jgi:BolA protein
MNIYNKIISTLNGAFQVTELRLENESSMHNVPADSETHFKLIIVSKDFNGLSKVDRHKNIYFSLNEIMRNIHALSIQAFTIEEYEKNPSILISPDCSNK